MTSPYGVVALSTVTYSTIFGLALKQQNHNRDSVRTLIKAVSAGHATVATCLTLISLYQPWFVTPSQHQLQNLPKHRVDNYLDDSQNPMIQGRNHLANFVTAWEAGYLIYDTGAMLLELYIRDRSRGYRSALIRLLRTSPVIVAHHVLLVAGLLVLQAYVVAGREKGLKIIMAFILMNASTPLLHLRWWRKKATGLRDVRIDVALVLVFAATRLGSVYWVMKSYGQYHGLGPWHAFRKQRLPCQAGTGMLTAFNALWWLGLLRQLARGRKAQY